MRAIRSSSEAPGSDQAQLWWSPRAPSRGARQGTRALTTIATGADTPATRGGALMRDARLSRRTFLAGAVGGSAVLALAGPAAPAVKKGTGLRLWRLQTDAG